MSGGFAPVVSYARKAVPMWVGTIFVLAGTLASLGSIGEWRAAQRFEREAVTARAAVIGTSLEAASRDGNRSTRYLLTYRFATPSGGEVEQSEEIPVEIWETLAAGDELTVRYLPEDPESARTRSITAAWVPLLVAALTAGFALLGALVARPGWRRLLVLVRVQRHGSIAHATVIEVAPAGIVVNRVPQWRLKYKFRDRHGERHEGESDYMRPEEAAEWRVGDQGVVRYDRDRASDSVWCGRA
jgi:hypothetical protein